MLHLLDLNFVYIMHSMLYQQNDIEIINHLTSMVETMAINVDTPDCEKFIPLVRGLYNLLMSSHFEDTSLLA